MKTSDLLRFLLVVHYQSAAGEVLPAALAKLELYISMHGVNRNLSGNLQNELRTSRQGCHLLQQASEAVDFSRIQIQLRTHVLSSRISRSIVRPCLFENTLLEEVMKERKIPLGQSLTLRNVEMARAQSRTQVQHFTKIVLNE